VLGIGVLFGLLFGLVGVGCWVVLGVGVGEGWFGLVSVAAE